MTTQLDDFETALLHELRAHVADRPARVRRGRTRIAVGVGLTAAAAVAAVVVVPGAGVQTAYSVQEGNSGEITVEVNRLEDAAGLERELEAYGVDADVTYVPDGGECAPGRYEPVARSLSGMTTGVGADLLQVTLPPGAVRDGETFVLAVSLVPVPATGDPDGDGISDLGGIRVWTDFDVASGPVAPCDVMP
ncbi:hypothetical protein [Nocardioides euryhalodurans]|uniref:Uncharacterized protein n=1 Tax=Nocardioides euryhalodurans TaxID=2518370 RepID=A0A4P7GP75_9ACTN|nr:hypothetical protein [Nocardioides euryhalodurans]QBR94038.1 hypothetical protein EXE57_18430 [Nocardioides euryhalodurans]